MQIEEAEKKVKKGGMILLKVNVFFFLIVKGAVIVAICTDGPIRQAARQYFGFDVMYAGIMGIVIGAIVLAKIKEYEVTGEIRFWGW